MIGSVVGGVFGGVIVIFLSAVLLIRWRVRHRRQQHLTTVFPSLITATHQHAGPVSQKMHSPLLSTPNLTMTDNGFGLAMSSSGHSNTRGSDVVDNAGDQAEDDSTGLQNELQVLRRQLAILQAQRGEDVSESVAPPSYATSDVGSVEA